MTDPKPPGLKASRKATPAMLRGLVGRCPNCGRGRLLSGYMTPISTCSACGENLAPYLTADFASYFVMFLVGLLATPLVMVLSMRSADSTLPVLAVCACAVASVLLLLPRAKGAGIGLLWALDVKANQ